MTPVYNEEKHIRQTIESVIGQSIKPVKWIIVDDGSTDRSAEIIKEYSSTFSWIQYISRSREPDQSYYASNVYALQKGVDAIVPFDCDYLAILDADITLPPNYYKSLSEIFASDAELGIVSGNCADRVGDELVRHLYDRRSCAKAVMVFRRACYNDIGGFVPLKYGGEDTCACFSARMLGWKTWAFHELISIHNKPLGTGLSQKVLNIRFRQGLCDWALAAPLSFVILKCMRRSVKEPPFILGGLARIVGYLYGYCSREKRQISKQLIRYIRKEQWSRVCSGNKIPKEQRISFTL